MHVLPTLWFRNQWSWHGGADRPTLQQLADTGACGVVKATDAALGDRYLYCEGNVTLLFTENETNTQRIFGVANRSPYVKDSINDYIVHGQTEAVNPEKKGTKAAAHYRLTVNPAHARWFDCGSAMSHRPLAQTNGEAASPFGSQFADVLQARRQEADEFYAAIIPAALNADATNVMRQALAGMLWSKQFYHYDVDKWLEERGSDPFKPTRKAAPRNDSWHHMYNGDMISMPDKWEYPWYAAWDLAFHVLALIAGGPGFWQAAIQADAARALHAPQRPDPSVRVELRRCQSTGACLVHHIHLRPGKTQKGEGDKEWLKSSFQKLLLNFTWWVNRKDRSGRNVFEGGFLGLDNIGVFDRSAPLPTGGYLEQADGTAWMALFCENMLRNRQRIGADRSRLRGHGAQVRRAFHVDRLGDGAPGPGHGDVG